MTAIGKINSAGSERELNGGERIDALYMEFPFLQEWLPRRFVIQSSVQSWDADFLSAQWIWTPEYRLYLAASDGSKITRVAGLFQGNESAGQALSRIGSRARLVRYAILKVLRAIHLYKLPNGFENAVDWLHAVTEQERQRIRQL